MDESFFINLSHEVRTPLNAVLGYSQELLQDSRTAPDMREKLLVIQQNGQQLMKLFTSLLDYSRLENASQGRGGDLLGENREFSLLEVIAQTAEAYRREAAQRNLRLRFPPPGQIPVAVRGNQVLYQKCLGALVENGVKFTEDARVTVEIKDERGGITTAVTDTGIGISEEEMPNIFTPFYQGDSSLSRKYGGLGLGLTLVKKIAESQGGSVDVLSPPPGRERGTQISFFLPYTVSRQTLGSQDASSCSSALEQGRASSDSQLPSLSKSDGIQASHLLQELSSGASLFDPERIEAILEGYLTDECSGDLRSIIQGLRQKARNYDDMGFSQDLKRLGDQVYGS